jgi:hypothetical protein
MYSKSRYCKHVPITVAGGDQEQTHNTEATVPIQQPNLTHFLPCHAASFHSRSLDTFVAISDWYQMPNATLVPYFDCV